MRLGSFRIAAEELCVSQSAVSHQIKHLEQWFGKPLFDRTGSRPKIMPGGEMLAQELRVSFLDIGAACQRARADSSEQTLVIAAIPSIAICWLIPRLEQFRSKYPDITISVVYAIHGQQVDFGAVDLAFVFSESPPDKPNIQADLFLSGTSVPVVSPALFERLDKSNVQSAVLDAGLLHDTNLDGWRDWFTESGATQTPTISGPIFEDFSLLRAAALSGQGVALCPISIIASDVLSHQLVPLSTISVQENYSYYLTHRESGEAAKIEAIDAFKGWVFSVRDNEPDVSNFLSVNF